MSNSNNQTLTDKNLRTAENITSSQKMMIFVLSMAMFGLSELVLEIVPDIQVGPFEIGISYFSFIPATLAALFAPAQVALGAVTGKVIFAGLLMGDFGGIGELESFIQMSLAIYVAGMLVPDPKNKRQLFIAPIVLVAIDKGIGGIVDYLKVVIGVAEFEAVPGLPESVLVTELFAFFEDTFISGVLLGAIPTMFLAPRLYGKIEPLLGMKPRVARPKIQFSFINVKTVTIAIVLAVVSGAVAFLDEFDMNFGIWEPDFIDQYGNAAVFAGIGIALVVLIIVILLMRNRATKKYEYD